MNPKVDAYIRRSEQWPTEMTDLRPVLLSCGLTEEIKWGKPCYSHEGRNIVILQEMKDFLALMFFKGPLLNDSEGVLEEQGPNSRSARRIRFTSVEDVARLTVHARVGAHPEVEEQSPIRQGRDCRRPVSPAAPLGAAARRFARPTATLERAG